MRSCKKDRLDKLIKALRPLVPYRTSGLKKFSSNLSRDLDLLVQDGRLVKAAPGIYYRPKKSWFGNVPVDRKKLIAAFLKSDDFVLVNYSEYNDLRLGTTQLYNNVVVYNRKRHGTFRVGKFTYEFRRVRYVPNKLTKEFLLVDMYNNQKEVAEDFNRVTELLRKKIDTFDTKKLLKIVSKHAKVGVRNFFEEILEETNVYT